MEMGLKGTVAVIAASSSGLGRAIAQALAEEGCNVVMCARRADLLKEAADEVRGMSGSVVLEVVADLSKADDVERVVQAAIEQFGRLDILVNNAGGPPSGEFTSHDDKAWEAAYNTNLMSAVRLIRAALPYLKVSGRGRIINLTSTAVKQPIEGLILSNALRAGVVGMAKTLALELAPDRITVNNIAPGRISTNRTRELDQARAAAQGITEEQARAATAAQIPAGHYGSPDDVAYLATFLASDKASYITGTTIQVDGGLVRATL